MDVDVNTVPVTCNAIPRGIAEVNLPSRTSKLPILSNKKKGRYRAVGIPNASAPPRKKGEEVAEKVAEDAVAGCECGSCTCDEDSTR